MPGLVFCVRFAALLTSPSPSGDAEAILRSPSRHKSDITVMISLVLAAVLFSPFLYHSFTQRLAFPSDSDQDQYLKEAKITGDQFRFAKVRQLYSSWLAGIYVIGGKDLRRAFYSEKTTSVLLLGMLVAFLGLKLFDARTALLLFIWVLNCKYLMTEPNGSHALAASMWVASVLCFYLPIRAAVLPASLLILVLSLKTREETIVPLLFIVSCLVIRAAYHWKRGTKLDRPAPASTKYWIGGVIIVAAMWGLFAARPNNLTSPYFSILIRTEFATTYVHRTGLRDQLPGRKAWVLEAWDVTYNEKLPGVKNDWDLIRLYPREELANIVYNIRITPRVAGAMFLAFDYPKLMLAAFFLYFISFIIWRGSNGIFQRWRPIPAEISSLLIIWGIGSFLVLAVVVPLYISSRHYVQLIPLEIIVTTFIIRVVMSKILSLIRPSSRQLSALP